MYMEVMDGLVLFGFGSDSGVNWISIREVFSTASRSAPVTGLPEYVHITDGPLDRST